MSARPQPQEPPLIRVTEAREVLAYVPHAMGFAPESSLVAVSLRPPRGRIGLVARVDLSDLTGAAGRAVARGLARHLDADGAAGIFLVLYVAMPVALARHRAAVRQAAAAVERAATVPVRDVWVVAEDGYASLRCSDHRCCPISGRPLEELGTTQVGAAMVVAGSAPVARRSDLRIGIETDPVLVAAFAAGARAERVSCALDRRDGREVGWQQDAARTALEILVGPLEPGSVTGGPDDDGAGEDGAGEDGAGEDGAGEDGAGEDGRMRDRAIELGRLSEKLRDVLVRDAVIAGVLTSRPVLSEQELVGALEELFLPGATPPDRDRVGAARAALADAVRLSQGRTRSGLLGVLAWLCWWCGDGAQAQVMAQEALDLDDGDRLALLVERALDAGTAPSWVATSRAVAG